MFMQVSGDFVTLYLDCMEYARQAFTRTHFGTMPFDPQSTIYVGAGGDIMGRKYEVKGSKFLLLNLRFSYISITDVILLGTSSFE